MGNMNLLSPGMVDTEVGMAGLIWPSGKNQPIKGSYL